MSKRPILLAAAVTLAAAMACAGLGSSPTEAPSGGEGSQPTNVVPPTNTAAPAPTATATEPPTAAPSPTEAAPPTVEGPLSFDDDFSTLSGAWDCQQCEVSGGELIMGPYPISGAGLQHVAYCDRCGIVGTYRMAVDVTFDEGQSDRGYGFMVRETDEYMLTYEITPWQTIDFWKANYETRQWEWINGQFSGAVQAGKQTNHIEIEVTRNNSGQTDISLMINGRTPLVIFNQPDDAGWVGLTLFGHALSVTFDNFHFETDETPQFPQGSNEPTSLRPDSLAAVH